MTGTELARRALPQRLGTRIKRTFGAWGVFFEGFLKHPVMVGSIIPSSRFTIAKMLDPVDWDYGSTSIRLHPFLCRIVGGELQPHEHDAVSWCAPDDLDSLEWAPADVPILASLRHRVGSRSVDSPAQPAKVPDR